MKKPWETGKQLNTEAKYIAWIRGALRKSWTRYPTQNEYKNSMRVQAPVWGENGEQKRYKTGKKKGQLVFRWECPCEECNKVLPATQIQVDHIISAGSTPTLEALQEWMLKLFCGIDNLQLLCKDCHDIKTYCDRYGVSKEEAIQEKEVIVFKKLKADKQKKLLKGLSLPSGKNAEERIGHYREHIKRGKGDV